MFRVLFEAYTSAYNQSYESQTNRQQTSSKTRCKYPNQGAPATRNKMKIFKHISNKVSRRPSHEEQIRQSDYDRYLINYRKALDHKWD